MPILGASCNVALVGPGSCPCCLTNAASHYRLTMALNKRQVGAVALGPIVSSQTNVREQSRVGYYNGNIITFFGV